MSVYGRLRSFSHGSACSRFSPTNCGTSASLPVRGGVGEGAGEGCAGGVAVGAATVGTAGVGRSKGVVVMGVGLSDRRNDSPAPAKTTMNAMKTSARNKVPSAPLPPALPRFGNAAGCRALGS